MSQKEHISTDKIVKGYEFNLGVDYPKILDSYQYTGIQSIYFTKAVETINKMLTEKD